MVVMSHGWVDLDLRFHHPALSVGRNKVAHHPALCAKPTFFERAQVEGLPDGEDGLDEDAHAALGRVDAADDTGGVTLQLNLNAFSTKFGAMHK